MSKSGWVPFCIGWGLSWNHTKSSNYFIFGIFILLWLRSNSCFDEAEHIGNVVVLSLFPPSAVDFESPVILSFLQSQSVVSTYSKPKRKHELCDIVRGGGGGGVGGSHDPPPPPPALSSNNNNNNNNNTKIRKFERISPQLCTRSLHFRGGGGIAKAPSRRSLAPALCVLKWWDQWNTTPPPPPPPASVKKKQLATGLYVQQICPT